VSAELQKTLQALLGHRARFGRPLGRYTTWRIGGPAWCLATVHSAQEAAEVIRATEEAGLPWMPLGRGSNLLVRDGGYRGVMLRLGGPLARLRLEDGQICGGGGTSLPGAVKLAARQGLTGLEWAAGIPASLGGAVINNAGAMGRDLAACCREITLLMPDGTIRKAPAQEFPAVYRRRQLPAGSVVLGAKLELEPQEPGLVAARTRAILERRRASQPLEAATAGSVFKNPPGDYAGRLIEAAGCKGLSRGDAVVSTRHANFIENRGRASAAQVLELMAEISRRVREQFGVELEPEVEVVGDD